MTSVSTFSLCTRSIERSLFTRDASSRCSEAQRYVSFGCLSRSVSRSLSMIASSNCRESSRSLASAVMRESARTSEVTRSTLASTGRGLVGAGAGCASAVAATKNRDKVMIRKVKPPVEAAS